MFELRFVNARLIKRVIDAIHDHMQEINMCALSTRLSSQSMDSSHVSLAELSLFPACAKLFRVDKSLNLGLSLKSLKMILKFATDTDIVTWRAMEDADDLTIIIENPQQTRHSAYTLKLMDISQELMAIPEAIYTVQIVFNSDALLKRIEQLEKIGDTMTIKIVENTVSFSAKGDIGAATVNMKCVEDEAEDIISMVWDDQCEEKALSIPFSLPYLLKFAKAKALAGRVTLGFSHEFPLKFQYGLTGDADENYGSLTFYLAPKIDDEHEQNENSKPLKSEPKTKVKTEQLEMDETT